MNRAHCLSSQRKLYLEQKSLKDNKLPSSFIKWRTGQTPFSSQSRIRRDLYLNRINLLFHFGALCGVKLWLYDNFQYSETCWWKEDNLIGSLETVKPHLTHNKDASQCHRRTLQYGSKNKLFNIWRSFLFHKRLFVAKEGSSHYKKVRKRWFFEEPGSLNFSSSASLWRTF